MSSRLTHNGRRHRRFRVGVPSVPDSPPALHPSSSYVLPVRTSKTRSLYSCVGRDSTSQGPSTSDVSGTPRPHTRRGDPRDLKVVSSPSSSRVYIPVALSTLTLLPNRRPSPRTFPPAPLSPPGTPGTRVRRSSTSVTCPGASRGVHRGGRDDSDVDEESGGLTVMVDRGEPD